ncbi:MAG: hypothetical protein ACD_56C00067G0003 [uncultured bacterium]|nr:MAG: hypothetical protein ACD_56C00067G0003 [uncultured bacterium]
MEKIVISAEDAGGRIDKFLAKEFFLYSRVDINKRIKRGEVLVNNKKIKPSYVLEEGNTVMLKDFSREEEDKSLFANKELALEVIFENEDMVVVNKEAGIQVHPSFNEKKNTLVNSLLAHYPEIINVHDGSVGAELRPGIVHRLDKDTSGVIVVARNMNAFNALKENFKNRNVEKQYLAIAKGIFKEKEGVIDKPIAKSSSYRKQVIARNNTKTIIRPAETHFKVTEEFDEYALVEVKPKTGRTHQIRIHLASIGHPIVGDMVYGTDVQKNAKKEAERQLLHAHELKFVLFGEKYEFMAPMPADFKEFIVKCGHGKR